MDRVAGEGIAQLPRTTETINPGEIGKWTHDADILRRLPTLQTDQDTSLADYYVGIPTPWARSIFFDYLFLNNDESKQERRTNSLVVDEWLGMLAAVLLGNDNIKKETFLPPDGGEINPLQQSILDLLPNDYPSPSEFQYDLIFLDRILIGSTSPYTLCFPCPEYSYGTAPVEWYDTTRRKFSNPLPHLDDAGKIRFKVSALEKFESMINKVQTEIGKIERDINDLIAKKVDCGSQQDKKTELVCKLKKLGDIKEVFLSYVKDVVIPDPVIQEIESGGERILIICEDTRLREGNIYLSEMLENERGFGNKIGNKVQKWINPKKFFMTDKILKWTGNRNRTTKFHNDVFIPPLSPNILNYYDINDIKLEFETEETDNMETILKKVTLKLPVNKDGQPGEMVIEKTYDGKVIDIAETPFLGMWPDFSAPDWDIYYIIYDKILGESSDLNIEPLRFVQEPFTNENKSIVKLTDSNRFNENETIIWQLDSFPHVLSCKRDGKDCGLIFPKPRTELQANTNSCILAIDFGASNTCYAYRHGDDIKTFQLTNHFLTLNGAQETRMDPIMDISFFPDFVRLRDRQDREMKPYFQSIYGEKQTSYFKVIRDGLIIFYTDMLIESKPPGITIRDNLKWLKNSDVFLNQLLLMLLADLRCRDFVSISEFRFSFPYAFDTTMRGHYQKKWKEMLGNTEDPDSLVKKTSFRHNPPNIVRKSESEAAALFMSGEQILNIETNSPQMVLDIGGSTTDIAIWAQNRMFLQTSILLAGNIVSQYISLNRKFLEFYWDKKNQKHNKQPNQREFAAFEKHFKDNPFNSFAALMSQEKNLNLVNNILMNPDKDELIEIKKLVAFIFSAYFFYTGKLVEYCYKNHDNLSYRPVIALVGKGSELIELILGRRPDVEEEKFLYLHILKKGIIDENLRNQVGFDGDSLKDQIKDTQKNIIDPKPVVAKGLLQSFVFSQKDIKQDRCWAIIGEEGFKKENQPLAPLEDLYSVIEDAQKDIDSIVIPDTFPELERFIGIFNNTWKNVLNFKEPVKYDPKKIKSRLETVSSDIKSKLYSLQPLFIEEVKAVIFDHWKFKMPRSVM